MKPRQSEYAIHCSVVKWVDRFGAADLIYYHPANQNNSGPTRGMHLKRMGVKAGVPDLVFLRHSKTLFMEIKSEDGKQSAEQKSFQEKAEKAGAEYVVVRSFEEAIGVLHSRSLVTKKPVESACFAA